jgi:membrane dipeptidase
MKYIDLHADTILPILQEGEAASLYENSGTHIDIKRLKEGYALAQTFAVWLPDSNFDSIEVEPAFSPKNFEEDAAYINAAIDRLDEEVNKNSEIIAWAENTSDIRKNEEDGKLSAILTLEDARAVDGSLENVERLAERGFQMVGILWNHENCFGYPNSVDFHENQKGLKKFGIEAVQYMDELGITTDVSHLNDGGIADVLAYSKKPVVASHSNARSVTRHPRNLTDEHIKGIAESGGVIGLCFAPQFIGGKDNETRIENMVRHLNYLLDIGGEDVLAIGTDFDGISGNLEIDSG